MALDDEKIAVAKPGPIRKSTRPKTTAKEADLGNALRSVYQNTVAETVPAEMLELLGKLG